MAALTRIWFGLQDKTFEGGTAAAVSGAGTIGFSTALLPEVSGKKPFGCAAVQFSGGESALQYPGMFTGAKERWTYYAHFVHIDKAPTATREIIRYLAVGSEPMASIKVNTAGDLLLFNGSSTQIKSVTGGLSFAAGPYGGYHLVEFAIWTHATEAAKCKVILWIDNTEQFNSEAFTGVAIAPEGARQGWFSAENTAKLSLTGIGVNDSTGEKETSRLGARLGAYLRPISDKANTGFTAGAGGTEKLWESQDNAPLTGVVLASATNTSQIKDANNNATDNVEFNLSSYETAGIGASDTVTLVQLLAAGGNSTVTSRTLSAALVSNPEIVATTLASGTTAAGTHPTGWKFIKSAMQYVPTVTKGTSPVLRLKKGTASTDSMMYEGAGLLVEFIPVAVPKQLAAAMTLTNEPKGSLTRVNVLAAVMTVTNEIKAQLTRTAIFKAAMTLSNEFKSSLTMTRAFKAVMTITNEFKVAMSRTRLLKAVMTITNEPVGKLSRTFLLKAAMVVTNIFSPSLARDILMKAAMVMTNTISVKLTTERFYQPGIYLKTGSGLEDWTIVASIAPPPDPNLIFYGQRLDDFAQVLAAPGRVTEVIDPAGSNERVFRLLTKNEDIEPITPTGDPRAQLITPSLWYPGAEYYVHGKTFFPLSFPVLTEGQFFQYTEIFGWPFEGVAPYALYVAMEEGKEFHRWQRNATYGFDVPWDYQFPLERGKWVDWIVRVRLAEGPPNKEHGGLIEMWFNGVKVPFFNPAYSYNPKGHAETSALVMSILDLSNDENANAFYIGQYRKHNSMEEAVIYQAPLKIGLTKESVE